MKVLTNQETIDEIKNVIAEQPEYPGNVRLYLAGMG